MSLVPELSHGLHRGTALKLIIESLDSRSTYLLVLELSTISHSLYQHTDLLRLNVEFINRHTLAHFCGLERPVALWGLLSQNLVSCCVTDSNASVHLLFSLSIIHMSPVTTVQ